MKLLRTCKARIGLFMVVSFFVQTVTPLVALATMPQAKKRSAHEETIIDFNINTTVKQIVEDAALSGVVDRLSDALKRCYKKLWNGEQALAVAEAWDAMPEVLRYAIEMTSEPNAGMRYKVCDFATLLDVVAALKQRMEHSQSYRSDDALMRVLALAYDKFSDDAVIGAKLLQLMSQCDQPTKKYLTMRAPALDVLDTLTDCCCPTSLTQNDVVSGVINLTTAGNYRLCEDITADLRISTTGISVDLNDRILTGLVSIHGDDVVLKNGFIQPLAPTLPGILPAVAVEDNVVNVYLVNLTITCADSVAKFNNDGLDGRIGILSTGRKTFIIECSVQAGAGANGGNSFFSGVLVPAGAGGAGGPGIISIGSKTQILRTLVISGAGGNGGMTNVGMAPAGAGGISGPGIILIGDNSCIKCCKVLGGDGGNGGQSCCSNGGSGGDSSAGIYNESRSAQIVDTTSRTGNGGAGGNGSGGGNAGGNGGNSGPAIRTSGTQIINTLLSTGNAGNGGNGGTGGSGGNAGYGLFVDNACETEAREIVVERTGNGGSGGNSSSPGANGGNGGSGADAVHITQNSKHTEVRNSTFSNTGKAGLGGTPGAGGAAGADGEPGRAITDENNDACSTNPDCDSNEAPSAIFSNFAYGIANTDIRYLINGKNKESGKASDKSCNRLDNVYVDCDVDKVFDICAAIADVEDTLTACCERLHEDIIDSETTILEALADCCGSMTSCCASLQEQLAECCDNLLECCEDTRATVTACCASLQEEIAECCEDLLDCCEDTRNTVTTCCAGLSEQLAACCIGLLDCCQETQATVTECCASLHNDIIESESTILDAIIACCGITTSCCDSLRNELEECCQDLHETVTTCCASLHDQIAECCEDLHETLTTCCASLHEDIANVSEQITECCDNLIGCCQETQATVTECCASLHQDIENSLTTIVNAVNDCCGTTTSCCEALQEQIADVNDTLTECCASLHQDIIDSETTILQAIADCCGTLTCCDQIIEDVTDVKNTLTECCASLHQDISDSTTIILHALADCCDTTTCATVDNITADGSFHLCANKCLVVSDDLPDFVYQGTTGEGFCPDACDTLATSTLLGNGCGGVSVNTCSAFDNINNFCGDSVLQWLKMIYILVRNINNDHRDLGLGNGKTSIPNL